MADLFQQIAEKLQPSSNKGFWDTLSSAMKSSQSSLASPYFQQGSQLGGGIKEVEEEQKRLTPAGKPQPKQNVFQKVGSAIESLGVVQKIKKIDQERERNRMSVYLGKNLGVKKFDLSEIAEAEKSAKAQNLPVEAVLASKHIRGLLEGAAIGSVDNKIATPVIKGVLDEVRAITKPAVKNLSLTKRLGTNLKSYLDDFRTNIITKFHPLREAERNVYKLSGQQRPKLDMARKFEQLAGAPGKAEADIHAFTREVVKPIAKNYDSFNDYLFLRRTVDRLNSDPERKKVGTWTIEKAKQGLQELREKIGQKSYDSFEVVANTRYQKIMDEALKLQVGSGRMTEETYNAIKKSNDFYAPFKMMKYLEETENIAGTGSKIPTTQQLTKKITGVEDEDLLLGDIMQQSAQMIYRSRILAEKNLKMQELAELAKFDPEGLIIRPVESGGFPVFINGEKKLFESTPEVLKALEGLNPAQTGMFSRILASGSMPLRWGVTTANAAFQIVNLAFADIPRLGLMSKYGVKNPLDVVRFPLDVAYGFFTALTGAFGKPNKMYMEWLKSGAANSTIAKEIMPETFKPTFLKMKARGFKGKTVQLARNLTIDGIQRLSNAIEETSKIAGLKRAKRIEGLDKMSPQQALKKMEEIVTEVRNFSGSPDFARQGAKTKEMNLLFMFFNARVQGATADLTRLAGKTGGKEAVSAWAKLSTAVGLPTLMLALNNYSPENRKDYEQIPERERENYWMIPRDKYFITEDGQKVRDYWRIPKREINKVFSNVIESAVKFSFDKDPNIASQAAMNMLEDFSPITWDGHNFRERLESVVSSSNPLIKSQYELISGRNSYYHTETIPERLKNVSSEKQYRDTTPERYIKLGQTEAAKALNLSPLEIQQVIQTMTGGLITQTDFGKVDEGRNSFVSWPVLKRFVRSRVVDETKQLERIETYRVMSNDRRIDLQRDAEKLHLELSSLAPEEANKQIKELAKDKTNRKLLTKLKDIIKDEELGLDYSDRLIKSLGVEDGTRALFIHDELNLMETAEEKNNYIRELYEKRVITSRVAKQLQELKEMQEAELSGTPQ